MIHRRMLLFKWAMTVCMYSIDVLLELLHVFVLETHHLVGPLDTFGVVFLLMVVCSTDGVVHVVTEAADALLGASGGSTC